jgi:hypothetical protein
VIDIYYYGQRQGKYLTSQAIADYYPAFSGSSFAAPKYRPGNADSYQGWLQMRILSTATSHTQQPIT